MTAIAIGVAVDITVDISSGVAVGIAIIVIVVISLIFFVVTPLSIEVFVLFIPIFGCCFDVRIDMMNLAQSINAFRSVACQLESTVNIIKFAVFLLGLKK